MTTAPFLSDDEIAGLCDGLVAPSAQIRYLQRMGLLVQRKPNGKPLLLRSELERVLGAGRFGAPSAPASAATPNRTALLDMLAKRKPGRQEW